MKTIELVPCAVIDLSQCYTRHLGGHKAIKYRTSAMVNAALGISGVDRIKAHIEREEGEEIQMVIRDINPNGGQTLQAGDLLFGDRIGRKIKKALLRVTTHSQLYQRTVFTKWSRALTVLFGIINYVNALIVHRLNFWLLKKQNLYDMLEVKDTRGRLGLPNGVKGILIQPIPHPDVNVFRRHVDPVQYLCVAAPKSQMEEAVKSLKDDLVLLTKKKLILGNMTMPSIMMMGNVDGMEDNVFALFCFFIPDTVRLVKIMNYDPMVGHVHEELRKLGVKNITLEGGINYLNGLKYDHGVEITEVNIDEAIDRQQVVVDNYFENRAAVEEAARGAGNLLGLVEDNPDLRQAVLEAVIAGREGQ